jgi:hypothetical protein
MNCGDGANNKLFGTPNMTLKYDIPVEVPVIALIEGELST